MGEPTGRADPDGPIARRQKGVGVAILPDQPFATAIVSPISLDQNISTGVRSYPNRSIGSSTNEISLVSMESITLPKVPDKQRFSLGLDPCNSVRIGISDPDGAIGGFRNAKNRIVLEAIGNVITAPASVLETQQAACSWYPQPATPVHDGLVENLLSIRSRKLDLLEMKISSAPWAVA